MTSSHVRQSGDQEHIGPYRILRRLGAGGQGVVYLGQDGDGQPVAVKVLRRDVAADEDTRNRFAREVAIAQRVASFCTAQFLAADLWSDPPYIVTEFVDGLSLQEEVTRNGPKSGPGLHRLAVGTATALTAIHEAGLVHRDFKPGNVLLGQDGPRVIDFGIARALDSTATISSHVIGTPAYMAPEQVSGVPIGPQADVFAWGAVVAFAATGRSPFAADSATAVLYRVVEGTPDIGGVPEPLRSLVARCLSKDPAERPAMQDVLLELLGSRDGPRAEHRTASPTERRPGRRRTKQSGSGQNRSGGGGSDRGRRGRSRRAVGRWGAAAAVVAVAAVAGLLWLQRDPAGVTAGGPAGVRTPVTNKPSPTALPARFPGTLRGVWRGALTQSDGSNHPMVVTIPGAVRSASVRYPSLGCSGLLTITSHDPGRYLLRETIRKGDRCSRQGLFTMQARGKTLVLTYIPSSDTPGDNYSATVTLFRPAT
ncbi:serine/threonine-protein kinase [Sphaerisporangium perillae]|uniref:serine/threonine-protein kinase n=1 Tax=Sphaerisporangium perillae TaxID=2935860 RepID=UPI00200F83C4|nr:serine/threonine-protein kinase [Sphaerisporangium perillae]